MPKMTQPQTAKAYQILDENLIRQEGERVEYPMGLSDRSIAEALGVSVSAISSMRQKHFGHLEGGATRLNERLSLIEADLVKIKEAILSRGYKL